MANESSPSRVDGFFDSWLTRREQIPGYTTFQHILLAEADGTREMILKRLAETVFIHHNDPDEFRENLATLGFPQLASALDKRPNSSTTRKANLGEVLSAEYLRQAEGYEIPIYRLRYNPNPESAMKGDDVVAFKFGNPDGSNREIAVVEAKTRGQYESRTVDSACEQLENGHRPQPKSLLFIVSILRKENREIEATKVLRFVDKFSPNQPSHRSVLFLLTGNQPQDPFGCIQNREKPVPNLLAINLCLPELDSLVTEVFEYEVKTNES